MNAVGLTFFVAACLLVLMLPRRLAALPLLLSAIYMTRGQIIEIGPATFTIPRLVIAFGFLRVLLRREGLKDGMHTVDRLVLLWAALLMGTSAFHTSDAWLYRSGLVWTEVGCYFLLRIFLQDIDDLQRTFKALSLAMIPVAISMLVEKSSGENAFGVLGGVNATALVRDGQIRASGPFAHPILAGTVGAFMVGAALAIWARYRSSAAWGILSGAAIVYAATSSGPIMMIGFILLGRWMWSLRHHMRTVRRVLLGSIIALALVMQDPVYFLLARIDISGGSQGYFRAQLIRSSINHLSEWWAAGTDSTRHWMASGIYANSSHTDITNHFLAMGVMGGLALMMVLVLIVAYSFRDAGRSLAQHESAPVEQQKFIWMLGALLFGFVAMFFGVSLFDQSIIFFYVTLAAIQTTAHGASPKASPVPGYRQLQAGADVLPFNHRPTRSFGP